MNKKLITGLIIAITVILGAVAVYTAWKISRLSTTAPEKSRAATTTDSCEITSFTISRVSPSPSPTPSGSPTASPSPTPTNSPSPSPTSSPTTTPTPTNTPSPTDTPSPTNSPTPIGTKTPSPTDRVSIPSTDSGIPAPGTPLPTLVLGLLGIIFIIIGIQITSLLGRR